MAPKTKSKANTKPASSTLNLLLKTPHNYTAILEETESNSRYHSTIRLLKESKFNEMLTARAPIYEGSLRQLWENAEVHSTKGVPYVIISRVGGTVIKITPQSISQVFKLNDMSHPVTFPISEIQAEFIERGYVGQLKGMTILKPNFPAEMRFFFHTILTCLSAKNYRF